MNKLSNAYIFGAGKMGRCAKILLENHFNILGFIDNDNMKHGSIVDGLEVYSPDILLEMKETEIVIAIKNIEIADLIKKQLSEDYAVQRVFIFEIDGKYETTYGEICDKTHQLIIRFTGGLGNQMFQFALMRYFQLNGKNCTVDLDYYGDPHVRRFTLDRVFPMVKIAPCSFLKKREYKNGMEQGEKCKGYIEPPYEINNIALDYRKLLDLQEGYISGNHQTYRVASEIRETLLKDFEFVLKEDEGLKRLTEVIKGDNYISVHLRRGDYFSQGFVETLGGICDSSYYDNAICLIRNMYPNSKLIFFSDDILWVKHKYENIYAGALFCNQDCFDDYEDWYDMYLMSICKHNIIANSTFSWWGAWLNQNPNKFVIAPKRWANTDSFYDICPLEWIRL